MDDTGIHLKSLGEKVVPSPGKGLPPVSGMVETIGMEGQKKNQEA
ncbi:MAG: hypothetical protein QM299_14510 [Pseudomonadota bacterium]|jgi:hypothetical protein|nr:hypothetical protein [Pseudomonadota bacterium]